MNLSFQGFKFNDKTLVSKSGYLFSEGEPNNKNGTQKCIVLRIGNVSTAHNHGTLDDVPYVIRKSKTILISRISGAHYQQKKNI